MKKIITMIRTLILVVSMTQAVEATEVYGPVLKHETEMHEIDMTNAYEYAIEQILIEYVLADVDPTAFGFNVQVQDRYYPDGVYKYAVCTYHTGDGQSQEDYWMQVEYSLK